MLGSQPTQFNVKSVPLHRGENIKKKYTYDDHLCMLYKLLTDLGIPLAVIY